MMREVRKATGQIRREIETPAPPPPGPPYPPDKDQPPSG